MGTNGFGNMVFTQEGLNLLAKAETGTQLQFTRVAVGDGYLNGQDETKFTALIEQIMSLNISSIVVSGQGAATVGAVLSNASLATGFYWREIGLFAQDPQLGEILFGYDNSTGHEIFVPPASQSSFTAPLNIGVYVSNASNVTAVIDQSLVFATLTQVSTAQAAAEAYTDAKFPVQASGLGAGSATDIVIGNRTGDPTLATPASTGTLTQLFGWIMGRIKAITGKTNWYDAPDITLASLNAHKSRHATGGADALAPSDIGAATSAQGAEADSTATTVTAHLAKSAIQGVHGIATTANLTYYVNASTGNNVNSGLTSGTALATIGAAIAKLPIVINHVVTINVAAGIYNETVSITGFTGSGLICLYGDTVVSTNYQVTAIICQDTVVPVTIRGFDAITTSLHGIQANHCKLVACQYCQCVGSTMGYYGFLSYDSTSIISNCLLSNKQGAIAALGCATISSQSNSGTGNNYGLIAQDASTIGKNGVQPSGSLAAENLGSGATIVTQNAQILSGGYKIQSGSFAATAVGSFSVTFPTAFTAVPVVEATYFTNGNTATVPVSITAKSITGATFYIGSGYTGGTIEWGAIGS